jgi:hypothetical protein
MCIHFRTGTIAFRGAGTAIMGPVGKRHKPTKAPVGPGFLSLWVGWKDAAGRDQRVHFASDVAPEVMSRAVGQDLAPAIAEILSATSQPERVSVSSRLPGEDWQSRPTCSFCGKGQADVAKLVAGEGVFICDQCIEMCAVVLEEDAREREEAAAGRKAPRRRAPKKVPPPAR